MSTPHPDHSSSPDGSAGWDALPPDGELPAEDAGRDAEDATDGEDGTEPAYDDEPERS